MANNTPTILLKDEPYGSYTPGKRKLIYSRIPKPAAAYPNTLIKSMDEIPFVHLNIVDSGVNKRTKYALGLPFPASVRVNYNASWESIDLGALSGSALEAYRNRDQAGASSWAKLKSGDTGGFAQDLFAGLGAVGSGAVGGAVTSAGMKIDEYTHLNAGAAVQIGKRMMVNPHAALKFSGMGMREFVLDFMLLPKSEEDSKQIREIIFQLKYAMHPEANELGGSSTTSGAALSAYFDYPNEFIIGFYAPNLKFLFRTSPCALLSCTVEYNGSGVPAFFHDDKPVCILLSLHFRENEILTKERIRQGW